MKREATCSSLLEASKASEQLSLSPPSRDTNVRPNTLEGLQDHEETKRLFLDIEIYSRPLLGLLWRIRGANPPPPAGPRPVSANFTSRDTLPLPTRKGHC